MTRNDWVLLTAAVAAVITAYRFKSIRSVRVLIPLDMSRPAAHVLGDRLLFRFTALGSLGSWAETRPRLLLAAFLLPLWGLLLNLLLPGDGGLPEFVGRTANWLAVALLIAGAQAAVLFGVLIILWSVLSAAFNYDPAISGYIAGVIIGLPGGGYASIGFMASFHESRLELRTKKTREGKPIPPGRLMSKRIGLLLQLTVPLMAIYTGARHIFPDLDLRKAAQMLSTAAPADGPSIAAFAPAALGGLLTAGHYALGAAAWAIAANVLWRAAPMFARLVEHGSSAGAAAFNTLWAEREEKRRTADPKSEEDRKALEDLDGWVRGGLDEQGAWKPFGVPQSLALFTVALYLTLKGFYETVESLTRAGMSADHPELDTARTLVSRCIAVGDVWLAIMFIAAGLERLLGRGRMPEENLELLRRSYAEPNLTVTCNAQGKLEAVTAPAGTLPVLKRP
jgi:hypothetical protein